MDDKIRINLQMADTTLPLTINRSEEEMVRKAAKQVDNLLNGAAAEGKIFLRQSLFLHSGTLP